MSASAQPTIGFPDLDGLRFDERGLVPVIAQDVGTGAVLMLAYANREALEATRESGVLHFWSRSRRSLWRKGETSGNELHLVELLEDCDRDALLARVRPVGPACHRGTRTCFEPNPAGLELGWLAQVLATRRDAPPDSSYTARLLAAGRERIAQKVGEEAVETVIAALGDGSAANRADLVGEASDLLYHLLVLLEERDIGLGEIAAALGDRHRPSSPDRRPQNGGSRHVDRTEGTGETGGSRE